MQKQTFQQEQNAADIVMYASFNLTSHIQIF